MLDWQSNWEWEDKADCAMIDENEEGLDKMMR